MADIVALALSSMKITRAPNELLMKLMASISIKGNYVLTCSERSMNFMKRESSLGAEASHLIRGISIFRISSIITSKDKVILREKLPKLLLT